MEKKDTVVAEKKVAFDRKGLFQQMVKAFAKNEITDVVADTERENTINKPEYEYVHFYKKGTETNIFQCYIKEKDCRFVVGLTLKDFLKQGKNYTLTPIEKKAKDSDEKRVVYVRVTCAHEDAVDVAGTILGAYQTKLATIVEIPEKKSTKKSDKKADAKKEPAKKTPAKIAVKKEVKKAANK